MRKTKYSKRFRLAYGPHRLQAGVPRRFSSKIYLAPRTNRLRDVRFPLTLTSVARLRHGHRRAFPSFSTDSPPKQTCDGVLPERCHDKQTQRRCVISRAKLCAVKSPKATLGIRAEENIREKLPNWGLRIACDFVNSRASTPDQAQFVQLSGVVSTPIACGSVLQRTLLGHVTTVRNDHVYRQQRPRPHLRGMSGLLGLLPSRVPQE